MSSVPQTTREIDDNANITKKPSVATPFLESFHRLTNVNQAIRIEALHALLNHLTTAQSSAEEASAKLGTLLTDPSLRICCADLTYAVNRLTRGLSSNRAAARQGFALALTEVLRIFPNVSIKDVVDHLIKTTSNTQNPTKSEMRDMALGRMIGTLAIVRSGRLQSVASSNGVYLVIKLLDAILPILTKRPWIGCAGSEAVTGLLECVTLKGWNSHVATVLEPFLQDPVAVWSPEQLSIALALEYHWLRWNNETNFPYDSHAERELTVFGNAPDAVKRLRASLSSNPQTATQIAIAGDVAAGAGHVDEHPLTEAARHSTVGFPAVHPMWTGLFQRYTDTLFAPTTDGDDMGPLSEEDLRLCIREFSLFWEGLIESNLLQATGDARRATALILLSIAIGPATASASANELVPILLSPRLLRALLTPLPNRENILHGPAKTAYSCLIHAVKTNPAALSSVLFTVLGRGAAVTSVNEKHVLSNLITTLLAELTDRPKEEAVSVLREHIFSMLRQFLVVELVKTDDSKEEDDSDDDSDVEGADDFNIASESLEQEESNASSELSPEDVMRLQTFEALAGAFTAPVLVHLRDEAILLPFLRFCAFHTHATVSVSDSAPLPEALAALPKTLDLEALLPSETDSDDVSQLLIATPPISPVLRKQLTSRITALTHTLAEMKASANVASGTANADNASDAAGTAGRQQKKKARVRASNSATDKATTNETVDRHIVLNSTLVDLAETINQAYDAALEAKVDIDEAGLDSVFVVSPSLEELNTAFEGDYEEGEEDSGSDSDSGESAMEDSAMEDESDLMTPFDARNMAKEAVQRLRSLVTVLTDLHKANTEAVPTVVFNEAMRQITMYTCFLTEVSLFVLSEVNESPARAQDAAIALGDLIAVMTEILSPVFSFANTLADLSSPTPSSTPTKKNRKKSKRTKVENTAAADVARLISELRELSAAAKGDDGDEDESDGASTTHDDLERATSVFIDALLSLLANANASLRNLVKSVLRNCLNVHTPEALQPVFDLIVSTATLFSTLDKQGDDAEEMAMNIDPEDAGDEASASDAQDDSDSDSGSDSDVDSDAETEEEDPFHEDLEDPENKAHEGEAPINIKEMEAEMDRYDRVFEQMLRLRREAKGSTKEAKIRAMHFRYRAMDILEAAANRCLTGSTKLQQYIQYQSLTDTPVSYAHPGIFTLLEQIVRTARRIAIKSRTTHASGNAKAADADLVGLLNKLCGVLQKTATRSRVPSIINNKELPREYATAGITVDAPLALLRSVVQLARSSALPIVADTCNAVTNMALRAMRAPDVTSHIPQPSTTALNHGLLDMCKGTLEHLLTAKRPRIGYQFFRTIFASLPVVSVHLLPVFTDAITNQSIPRPFRIGAAYEQMNTILKAAAANWAKDLPCGGTEDDPVTVSQVLQEALPSIYDALTVSLQASIEDYNKNADAKKGERVEVPGALAPNAQREHMIPMVRFFVRSKLLRTNALPDKLKNLLAEYASVIPNRGGRKSVEALCKDLGIVVGAGDEATDTMEEEEEKTPTKKGDLRATKRKKNAKANPKAKAKVRKNSKSVN